MNKGRKDILEAIELIDQQIAAWARARDAKYLADRLAGKQAQIDAIREEMAALQDAYDKAPDKLKKLHARRADLKAKLVLHDNRAVVERLKGLSNG